MEQRSMLVQDFLEGMTVVDSGSMVSYFWKRSLLFARRGAQGVSLCLSCDVDVKDMIRMCLEKGKRMVMLRITALDGSNNRVVETIGMIRILHLDRRSTINTCSTSSARTH
jgi:hypothetical protein